MTEYPKTPQNSISRLRNRGHYDFATIHGIINSTAMVHVAFAPDPSEPFPAVLPMIGTMGSFEKQSAALDEPLDCYLHGYVSSRIMRCAKEAVARGEEGLPICVEATKLDGYKLALTPFHHSYNYRSAVLHGHAQLVEDDDEKLWAMEIITNSVVPDRWKNSKTPPSLTDMKSTNILRIKVAAGSAKIGSGLPADEKKDIKDEELNDKVWTGVMPIWETFGEPIPGDYNKIEVPGHVRDYIQTLNKSNKEAAFEAAKKS